MHGTYVITSVSVLTFGRISYTLYIDLSLIVMLQHQWNEGRWLKTKDSTLFGLFKGNCTKHHVLTAPYSLVNTITVALLLFNILLVSSSIIEVFLPFCWRFQRCSRYQTVIVASLGFVIFPCLVSNMESSSVIYLKSSCNT